MALALVTPPALSQSAKEPEREQLLNGLKLLIWEQPGSPELTVKLRINSGAAFDLAGKSGQMALLGDLFFPDASTIDFFTDELGGKLDVSVNYDSVTITMVGKAAEFEQMISVLRNAILSTQFTPEVVTRVRDARIKTLRDLTVSPATVADRAIAARLFGDFPYGRRPGGTPEDVARVDRADLMTTHERFINSNNATLAIVGGVTRARAFRTVRQLLGPWRKSEKIVPTTFTQPKAVDPRALIVNVAGPTTEVRLAVRGVARSDADFAAAEVLARVAQHRWQAMAPELANQPLFVSSDAYVLPGMFVMGAAVGTEKTVDALASARKVVESLVNTQATAAELDRARTEVVNETVASATKAEAVPDPWLDADTYRFSAVQDQAALLRAVTPADVQRVAKKLFKDPAAVATVVAGEVDPLKTALQGRVQFEVLGEVVVPTTTPKTPAKPAGNANPR
ncbi:MAG TPA: pitrilysin family protein [Pyrinomonadaceae bacterium]|nr:pitrilysin family protein [Pyrinomonadaceae bacterium]